MKTQFALVSLAAFIALTTAPAKASADVSTAAQPASTANLTIEISQPTPQKLKQDEAARTRHLFQVNDEKGLLLTCIAPDIETNSETDVFKNCALAPGRTLDDLMHSFVRGIHAEQNERLKEQAQSAADAAKKSSAQSAQK
jgi:hypothetical protein